MKKVISLVMALVMMMAIMVPAFAADQTVDTAGQYTADVKTTYVDGDATYSVTSIVYLNSSVVTGAEVVPSTVPFTS